MTKSKQDRLKYLKRLRDREQELQDLFDPDNPEDLENWKLCEQNLMKYDIAIRKIEAE